MAVSSKTITPVKLQEAAQQSFDRMSGYRKSRAMFVREYVGQYYMKAAQHIGTKPINLIYTTVRALVPNLVMRNPKVYVGTENPQLFQTADALAKDINSVIKDIKLSDTLRAVITDALFGFGIVYKALKSTDKFVTIEDMRIETGQFSAGHIDLDDFCFDPTSTMHLFTDSAFLGHRTRVPRQLLLDYDGYNHDIINKLDNSFTVADKRNKVRDISQPMKHGWEFSELRDLIDVVSVYLPKQNMMAIVADPESYPCDEYIRDPFPYHGPEGGPYSFLSFSQPVPNNPVPVAPVSLWFDMHNCLNDIFTKAMDQSLRQKNIGIYDPANADVAEDIRTARDGDMIAGDPSTVNDISLGGQNDKNIQFTGTCQTWYNYLAGNPDMLAGLQSDSNTATQANILAGQAGIVIQDSREIIEDFTADICESIAWYTVDDPLDISYSKENWIEFQMNIVPKSMTRLDPNMRVKRTQELYINVIPALAQTTVICAQMNIPFNFSEAVFAAAEGMDIEDSVLRVFNDPDRLNKMAALMLRGPANPGKADGGTSISSAGIKQQGGYPGKQVIETDKQINNQAAQATAAVGQEVYNG